MFEDGHTSILFVNLAVEDSGKVDRNIHQVDESRLHQ
jgi:hypothetical protein